MEVIGVIAMLSISALILGGVLGFLSQRAAAVNMENSPLTDAIDAALPQLQCAECGYPGCRPYALAVANDEAPINLCPPGGQHTANQLARILNRETPSMPIMPPRVVAVIRADDCVGCALCLPACPTDAIIGAPQFDHVVITEHCIGCRLCLPPCPTNCIDIIDIDKLTPAQNISY